MILRCCAYELSFINVSQGHFPKRNFREVSFFVVVEIQIKVKNNSLKEQKQPHNYKGHAVSTSDVLILNDNGVTTTYYVNKDTFIEIPDFMKVTSSESGGLTKDTVGYEIEGKDGTWEVIDYLLVEEKNYFLMEHEQYRKDVAYVVLDQKGNVLVDSTYNGFDDVVKQKILDSLHPPVQEQTEGYKPKLDNWQEYMENTE